VQGGDEDTFRGLVAGAGGGVVRVTSRDGGAEAVVDLPAPDTAAALTRALVLAGWSVEALEPLTDALEDAFRQAVAQGGSAVR
jgi:hypothetical protein